MLNRNSNEPVGEGLDAHDIHLREEPQLTGETERNVPNMVKKFPRMLKICDTDHKDESEVQSLGTKVGEYAWDRQQQVELDNRSPQVESNLVKVYTVLESTRLFGNYRVFVRCVVMGGCLINIDVVVDGTELVPTKRVMDSIDVTRRVPSLHHHFPTLLPPHYTILPHLTTHPSTRSAPGRSLGPGRGSTLRTPLRSSVRVIVQD